MSQESILIEIFCLVAFFILGAILGSFACCQAWRIRYEEQKKKPLGKWSVCLSCGKRLKPIENIPIFSWIIQKGKCKKCGAKIGKAEILSELSLGLAFVAISFFVLPEIYTSQNVLLTTTLIVMLILLFIITTIMWILMIYDAKWHLLPTRLLTLVNILAAIYCGLGFLKSSLTSNTFANDFLPALANLVGGVALLAGIYFLLYFFSKEKWVGSGDWLLALAISLVLGNLWLSLLVLFLSNFLASIVGIRAKIKKGNKTIPFGPFLVIAFVIVYSLQTWLISLVVI